VILTFFNNNCCTK